MKISRFIVLIVMSGACTVPMIASADGFSCPEVRLISGDMGIRTRYISKSDDPTSSTLDPGVVAEQESVRSDVSYPAKKIVNLSLMYARDDRRGQRQSIGECIRRHAGSLKDMHYLEGRTESDMLYKSWMISAIGLSLARLEELGFDLGGEAAAYRDWASMRANEISRFYREHGCRNNHCYWAGLATAVTGRYVGDSGLLDFSRWTVQSAMEAATSTGDLPAEVARGKLAVHYSAFAAAALVSSSAVLGDISPATRNFLKTISQRVCTARNSVIAGTYDGEPQDLDGAAPYLHLVGAYAHVDCSAGTRGTDSFRSFFLGWDPSYITNKVIGIS